MGLGTCSEGKEDSRLRGNSAALCQIYDSIFGEIWTNVYEAGMAKNLALMAYSNQWISQ